MSWVNNQLAELTWEKGQLSMNGLRSTSPSPKPIWASRTSNDTLESIVHQATFLKPPPPPPTGVQSPPDITSATTAPCRKRSRSDSNVENKSSRIWDFDTINHNHIYEVNYGDGETERGCAAAASGGESGGTVMTWPLPASFPTSNKRTAPTDEDHPCRARSEGDDDEEEESNKIETSTKSLSSANTRSRTATVHNQSERRRRERINQKMKALQKLVPYAHKTDKASMLDEVIDYLKQLQAQIEMMSHTRSMVAAATPQMIIPIDALHQQHQQQKQQLQMSLFTATQRATMGGVGLGMGLVPSMHIPLTHTGLVHLPTTKMTSPTLMNTAPQFLHHQAAHINHINNCQSNNGTSSSIGHPFDANMELYMRKLAAIYQQEVHQHNNIVHGTHAINGASQQSNRNQGAK